MGLLSRTRRFTVDEPRKGIESIPSHTYDRLTYYERWIGSMRDQPPRQIVVQSTPEVHNLVVRKPCLSQPRGTASRFRRDFSVRLGAHRQRYYYKRDSMIGVTTP